jgi:hypothetical protein
MIDLTALPPADLAYLALCVELGRVSLRGRKKPTWFAKAWLENYAREHENVTWDEKGRRLRYSLDPAARPERK